MYRLTFCHTRGIAIISEVTEMSNTIILCRYVYRVGRGREPWERSEASGVNGNERNLHPLTGLESHGGASEGLNEE